MKTSLLVLILALGSSVLAATESPSIKSYKFIYKGETFEVRRPASDDNYKKAAQECFDHFRKSVHTEDAGLDVIDVCANPRS